MSRPGLLTLCFLAVYGRVVSAISLSGRWTGTIVSSGQNFSAKVPGGIYSDLAAAGLIPPNLLGFNDVKNRWVSRESYIYVTQFEVNEYLLNSPQVALVFHGLDTFANIYVNNVEVGSATNMFVRYTFDVKNHLVIGRNELKVKFASPVITAEDLHRNQSYKYVIPPACVPKEYNGECHVNHIRKMQASFGWDWGGAYPSIGIWKDVELQPANYALVSDVTADVYKINSNWEVVITVFFDVFYGDAKPDVMVDVTSYLEHVLQPNNAVHVQGNLKNLENPANMSLVISVPSNKIKMWWPNGYGGQSLYTVRTKIVIGNDITERRIKVGFRTVELVQQPLKKGRTFYFRVNGVSIFAKGSNWIPASIFPELSSNRETVKYLLDSAKDVHMNMLRVWGGGMYESDLFYDMADEYGIMIWQDFMFACSMYPANKWFLKSVSTEIVQNIRRLKRHPSIVIWAGNNENEVALYGNWYGTGRRQVYRDDYLKLYVNVIRKEVKALDPSKPFVVSSPSDGSFTDENNFLGPDPMLKIYGDMHYYNYLRNGWDNNQYPVTRFASEYGFQSLPSIWTFTTAAENVSSFDIESPFMKHRQHLPAGMAFMKLLISKNLALTKTNDTVRDLVDLIYLSQVNQAVSVRVETETYRQMKSTLNDAGEGYTMGALYWQLNDVWQAPSWSSIEFGGRWKMLHYYAKDFFAPVIITSRKSVTNDLSIYVVSDLLEPLHDLTVKVFYHQWNQTLPLDMMEFRNITVEANEAKLVDKFWMDDIMNSIGCGTFVSAKENCMLELMLENSKGEVIAPVNYVYPIPLKNVSLPKEKVTVRVEPESRPGKWPNFQIELLSDKKALFVWLEVAGQVSGYFSENGFHIMRGRKTVIFHAREFVTLNKLVKNLKVTTLSGIYAPNRKVPNMKDYFAAV